MCFFLILLSRSAPPSPTHHLVHHNDLNLKDMSMESKFTLPAPPTTSHFTLPTFLSQIQAGALNSSHSLPASPSRPPPGFTATPLKFFPITTPIPSRASDDLDLVKSQRKLCGTIHEVKEEENENEGLLPPEKRARLDDHHQMENVSLQQQQQQGHHLTQVLTLPTVGGGPMSSFSGPRGVQLAQPGGPAGQPLHFLPISLMSSASQQPHQGLLGAPLSSFLPQSYFNQGAIPGAGLMGPVPGHTVSQGPPVAAEVRSNGTHGNTNEG